MYLAVELKETNLALVATGAFPGNLFQAPRQEPASPSTDVASFPGLVKPSDAMEE